MTPEQWTRVKAVFHGALAEEPGRRQAYVDAETADDAHVRTEVERLLEADRHTGTFIEQPAAATLLNGRVIGHYEIGDLLGTGGMGRVYAARDTELGRHVAFKVAAVGSQEAQARLRREAQHASRLSHPHICHIYDVGRADGELFIVMELIEGRPLAEVIREGPLPVATATRYGSQIADALAHAHERGVTHRDLKSTNVMVTRRGVKVLDFGLARTLDTHRLDVLSHSQRSLTDEGTIAGTLAYMAPELLRGERGDQRADVWALGVLMYEMVSGRRPFTGATGFELSAAILHQAPAGLPAGVPAPVAGVIERCLAKNPSDRYQQAAEVHAVLEAVDTPQGSSPRPPTRARITPARVAGAALLLVIGLMIASVLPEQAGSIVPVAFENTRGYSLLRAGEFEKAVEMFEAIADRAPTDANAWDSLGEGQLASGMAEKALEAYTRALALDPDNGSSALGRALSLAALGLYDQVFQGEVLEPAVRAFLLSRVGRYSEATKILDEALAEATEGDEPDEAAAALTTAARLLVEREQYGAALERLDAVDAVADEDRDPGHALLVFGDLLGGMAEIRAGNASEAASRLARRQSRADNNNAAEANWAAALDAEVALAQGDYERALRGFDTAERPRWLNLGHDVLRLFASSPPSRDGRARVELARGNRAAAIEEYRRLTAVPASGRPAGVLEPRHVLALARLLAQSGDAARARAEYERFLRLWEKADSGLPELAEAREALARPGAPEVPPRPPSGAPPRPQIPPLPVIP